jgi:hypothetical protein
MVIGFTTVDGQRRDPVRGEKTRLVYRRPGYPDSWPAWPAEIVRDQQIPKPDLPNFGVAFKKTSVIHLKLELEFYKDHSFFTDRGSRPEHSRPAIPDRRQHHNGSPSSNPGPAGPLCPPAGHRLPATPLHPGHDKRNDERGHLAR